MEIGPKKFIGFSLLLAGVALCGGGLWLLLSPAQYQATARIETQPDLSITPPAMMRPLEPLGLSQEPVFVSSVSPDNLKSTAAVIAAAGGKHRASFALNRARLSQLPLSALADGREYHDQGINHYNACNFTNSLADFRKSCELGSDTQDYSYFRIWLIRARLGEKNAATLELAAYLERRKAQKPDDWPSKVGRFLAGQLSESDFLNAADYPNLQTAKEQHCEAWFYAASKRLIDGDNVGAADDFKKCLTTNVTNFEEYTSAASELSYLQSPPKNP